MDIVYSKHTYNTEYRKHSISSLRSLYEIIFTQCLSPRFCTHKNLFSLTACLYSIHNFLYFLYIISCVFRWIFNCMYKPSNYVVDMFVAVLLLNTQRCRMFMVGIICSKGIETLLYTRKGSVFFSSYFFFFFTFSVREMRVNINIIFKEMLNC